MRDLPKDQWVTVELDEVCEIIRGLAFPTTDKSTQQIEGTIACLRTTNVQQEVEWEDLWYIPIKHVRYDRQIIRIGDILISTANSFELVGKVAQVKALPRQATLGAFISLIRPVGEMNESFLYYQLASFGVQSEFRKLASTTTNISNVSTGKLRGLRVRVAPLAEQDRIVAEIEKQFTRLDAATAALKRVQANLKRYRASVLKAACEGRMVPAEAELARKEGRDYEPASELLKRILRERRARWEADTLAKMIASGKPPKDDRWKQKYKEPSAPDTSNLPELPEGWCWTALDSLIYGITAGKSFKCEERPPENDEFGVVKVSSVTWGVFDELESKTCLAGSPWVEAYRICPGDFLFSRANTIELVGACVMAGNVNRRLMLSDKILRFEVVLPALNAWLLAVLRSEWGRSEIEDLSTGNQESMRNIGQDRIRRIRVPIPPFKEMTRIVESVDMCESSFAKLGASTVAQLKRSLRLRSAILNDAFSGQLAPQDPTDEPASALLKRVRAERAKLKAPMRRGKQLQANELVEVS